MKSVDKMEGAEPKYFSARIKAEQVGEDLNIFGFLSFMMICGVPGFWLAIMSLDNTEQVHGWLAFIYALGLFGGFAVALVGFVVGAILWFMLEDYFRKAKGLTAPFNQYTVVSIDENGLNIKDLGLTKWPNVLRLEGVPDAEYALFVHTTSFGKLLLHHDANTLAAVLNFHSSQNRTAVISDALSSKDAAFEFKAVIFHWPKFFTWILAAYLIAIAIAVGLPIFNPHAGFFKNMVAIFVLAPLCWMLVWTIPMWQISLFAGKRTKAFDLTQDRLTSKDRIIGIDLRSAKISFHHKTGIGYVLDFIAVKPQKGKRIDLLVDEEEMAILRKKLN
jgi:hypothetical protein